MAKPQTTSKHAKKRRIRDELIYDAIMEHVNVVPDKAVRPEDIAMSIQREDWQILLKRVRLFASKLAIEGYLNIIRKGKIVDPNDFKGVYRIKSAEKAPNYTPRMPSK